MARRKPRVKREVRGHEIKVHEYETVVAKATVAGFTFRARPGESVEELADRAEATLLSQLRERSS